MDGGGAGDELAGRWDRLWAGLELVPPRGAAAAAMLRRWSEPHRHYHTGQHLAECLSRLDEAGALAVAPRTVELALWYHDAVYRPLRADNERRSARLARSHLSAAGAPASLVADVEALVLATRHEAPPPSGDTALTVDIDLAILGEAPVRFAEYEDQIRREFRLVPGPAFRAGRASVLEAFLARPRIYATDWMAGRFEAQARVNLQGALRRLG